ncbi:MAG: hypothetical protein LCI00_22095 [Chloroflexi bacterium]|nr:hypothetical protein [Chloroflexota bacterium]MCC6895158.1 hypothetical protein [Anaerolineae bacterium]
MVIKNPKTLAVDTSVMLAASSGEHILDGEAKLCRDFMEEILKVGHKIIFTPEIVAEWDKYDLRRKTFVPKTIPWYIQMQRRGLVSRHSDATRSDLREAVFAAVEKHAIKAVEKDMRWVEGALLGDKCIASHENKARGHFKRAAQTVDEIKSIIWVNPRIIEENCIYWLREGAPADEHRTLGYVSPED